MERPVFDEETIYHIYNRGVEKRNIFSNDRDRFRFIHDLYEFNDEDPASNMWYYFNRKISEVQPHYHNIPRERKKRKLLVEILAFVLMPNHYHLLLRQVKENGIIRFMQKLGTGYTMYFNKVYNRSGVLFQGRYKSIAVAEEPHFIYLPFYIHANPLKTYRGSTSLDGMMKFLEGYRWSSFPDYLGRKNFPSLTSRTFLSQYFGGPKAFFAEMRGLLKERGDWFEKVRDVSLDRDFD
jgi:putative transposase